MNQSLIVDVRWQWHEINEIQNYPILLIIISFFNPIFLLIFTTY
jgi:hypothetical protein